MAEGVGELVDNLLFFRGQGIGIPGIHGGEIAVFQRVDLITDGNGLVFVIDLMEQQPVSHAEFGPTLQLLALQLKEDDGDGLVHPGRQQLVLFGVGIRIGAGELDVEAMGIAVPVDLVGEDGKRPQGDTVTGFDDLQIVVMDGVAQHCGNQSPGAGTGAHPQNVVIAPLDVHAVAGKQAVHDDIRPGAPVENVAHDVQVVNGKLLDGVADGLNHVTGLADPDNGADEVFVVFPLILLVIPGVEQLIDDVPVALRHGRSDLGAGVLDGDPAAQQYQPVQCDAVPLLHVVVFIGDQGQLCGRVVDQGGQIVPVPLGHGGTEELIQLVLDFAGAGVENVQEGFVFTVDVRQKMFGTLGQVQKDQQGRSCKAQMLPLQRK